MLRLERRQRRARELIPSTKPATRRELYRRIGLGRDVHPHAFREPIGLKDVARAAHLSPFHFLRDFQGTPRRDAVDLSEVASEPVPRYA